MQPVPIYYEESGPEEDEGKYSHIQHKKMAQTSEARWHPEARINAIHADVPADQWVKIFLDENYGQYEEDFREVERRYNEDRQAFLSTDVHDPELIPCAEQFQDTLAELMTAAKLIFDKIGKTKETKSNALALMNRVSKDCFVLEKAVSDHAETMIERYPDDDILRSDLSEIDSEFLDFYLDVYKTLEIYKKKGNSSAC